MRTDRCSRLWAGATILGLLCAGCGDGKRPPRELPIPQIEPASAFPELTRDRVSDRSPVASKSDAIEPSGSFAPVTGTGSGTAPERATDEVTTGASSFPAPAAKRLIPLGTRFLGELPADGRAWRWATGAGRTFAVYLPARGSASAALYVEPFSPAIARSPSIELAAFRSRLFRTLEPLDLPLPVAGATSDLGFTPTSGSFTGWRWVGETEQDLTLRLARFGGVWHRSAPGGIDRIPAYLILGTVQGQREELGIHLALVCSQAPRCPVAEELARLLESIRLAATDDPIDTLRLGGALVSVDQLAEDAGLSLPSPAEPRTPDAEERDAQ